MRKYAYLKDPVTAAEGDPVVKVMLCEAPEGFYLFEYSDPDAQQCSADLCYDSLEDLYGDWNALIDERGWIDIDDPLPDCQHDAFLPIRVKGRSTGTPEWGKFEVLQDGEWVEYKR